MDNLISYIDTLSTDLRNKLDDNTYRSQIQTARTNSEYTVGPFGGQIERIIDLYEFVFNIYNEVSDSNTKATAQNIMNLMGPAGGQSGYLITNERHSSSANFCNGLSVYFPDRLNRYDGAYLVNNNFVSDTSWDEFLDEYLEDVTGMGYGWDSYIKVTGGVNSNAYYTFGEDENATDDYDEGYDIEHINSPTDVEMYSKINSTNYGVDIKSGPDSEKIWDVYVEWEGTSSETIELNWDVSSIPHEEYNTVILFDPSSSQEKNMRLEESYTFTLNAGDTRHLEIKCMNVENNAPLKPQAPSGPKKGRINTKYDYTAVTIDPEGDTISYIFNWGDDTTSQTSFVPSGEQVTKSHSWSEQGTFNVKVKAIDEKGAESDWSDSISVIIPKNKACYRIIQLFPIFQKILPILFNLILKYGPERLPGLFIFLNKIPFNQ
jgi:hypothetical protein